MIIVSLVSCLELSLNLLFYFFIEDLFTFLLTLFLLIYWIFIYVFIDMRVFICLGALIDGRLCCFAVAHLLF